MPSNPLRQVWAEGRAAINVWLAIPDAFAAEVQAAQGADCVTIDMQHGLVDYAAMTAMLQGAQRSPAAALVRVPWLEPGVVMKTLDAGAWGVICPMVNTAEDAARLVSYMRYPPRGTRSFGPTRAAAAHGAGYYATANDQVVALAMIETKEALANVDAIAQTPDLDGLYIGPADLTISLTDGRLSPGFDREEPEMLAAIHTILAAAKRAGIRACLHCGTPEYAAKAIGWGFDLVTLSTDARILATAVRSVVDRTRALSAEAGAAGEDV